MYRKFSAKRIFDGVQWAAGNQVLITDEHGKIETITSIENAGEDIVHLDGILLPGLVNAHVHLELSHMKNVIPPKTGIVQFLMEVISKRGSFSEEVIQEAIKNADAEMWNNGIVAAGDICNTSQTLQVKKIFSRIVWKNFIEIISLRDEQMDANFESAEMLLKQFDNTSYRSAIAAENAIVPHAPYSVSDRGFEKLNKLSHGKTISIHNQESEAENDLFEFGTGDFLHLYKMLGYNRLPVRVTHRSSLQSYLPHFDQRQKIIFVHNTAITKSDIEFFLEYTKSNHLHAWFCLCPNANLYIEDKLPDIRLMEDFSLPMVIGTDSYASNYRLSIGAEIATLAQHFPEIDISFFLRAATSNGADALGLGDNFGRLREGSTPGIVLLKEDFSTKRIL